MKKDTRLGLAGLWALVVPAAGLFMLGCGPSGSRQGAFRGVEAAERYAEGDRGRQITALSDASPLTIEGEAIDWAEIAPRLSEAAGGLVVEELALERLLTREVGRRGLSISEEDLALERAWLLATIAEGKRLPDAEASLLIWEVRQRRGLGPVRFASLLRRNALLRALVHDRVEVRPDQVELAWRVQHGERVRVRIIVAASQQEAHRLRNEALAGEPNETELRFATLAEAHSTDASASRGGLIEPFSTKDPAYEQAIRQTAEALQPGDIGPIVPVGHGFAVVYLDQRLPGDGTAIDEARAALTEQLRRRQERLLMDELATQLLAHARVNVIDQSLSWSVRAGGDR